MTDTPTLSPGGACLGDLLRQQQNDNLIQRDSQGDVIPLGTKMIEKESYERVIDGLRIAAEACAHLAFHYKSFDDVDTVNAYAGIARRLDQCRLICVDHAKLGDTPMKQQETAEVRKGPMHFSYARKRMRDGLKQASGGMRQLATCHRGDLSWSRMAGQVEEMLRKAQAKPSSILRPPPSFKVH